MTDSSEITQLLREAPFLEDLSEERVADVALIAREEIFPRGQVLFDERTRNSRFYLIHSGKIVLELSVPGKGHVSVLTLGPGKILGWSALLRGKNHMARATVIDAARVIVLDGQAFQDACARDPVLGHVIYRRLAEVAADRLWAARVQLLDFYGPAD